jgi:hypothetical protein
VLSPPWKEKKFKPPSGQIPFNSSLKMFPEFPPTPPTNLNCKENPKFTNESPGIRILDSDWLSGILFSLQTEFNASRIKNGVQ